MNLENTSTKSQTESKKERARWLRIKRIYGITKEQYDELNLGNCPICLRDFDGANTRPAVDHDHKTGEVRGILCLYCNRYRVGNFRDGALVRRIADYLDAPRRGWIVPPKPKKKRRKTSKGTEGSERKAKKNDNNEEDSRTGSSKPRRKRNNRSRNSVSRAASASAST